MSEEETTYKIIIAGLDSAGKSTIYRRMIEGADFEDIKDLPPTKGIERRSQIIMGHQLIFWDLGGQQAYRSQYFENPRTFLNASLLIYVLDVQDKDRFDLSLDYLLQILMVVKDLDVPPRIFILMHKFDPDKIPELKDNFLEASKIFREVKKIPQLQISRFPTSIHSNNLNFAFKKILQKVVPDYSNPLFDLLEQEFELEDLEDGFESEEDSLVAELEVDLDHANLTDEDSLRAQITKQFEKAIHKIEHNIKEKSFDKTKESMQG